MRVHFPDVDMAYEVPPEADRMSEEEFFQFCIANPELNIERDKNGNIELMAPVGNGGGIKEMHAMGQLYVWNMRTNAGYVFSSAAGFILPNKALRSPDASWIPKARYDALPPEDKEKFPRICPDFMIEVRSASDSLRRLEAKMDEYMENGCRLAFLIDPLQQKARVYEQGKEAVEVSGFHQKLSGGEVLPGFELDLSLFVS